MLYLEELVKGKPIQIGCGFHSNLSSPFNEKRNNNKKELTHHGRISDHWQLENPIVPLWECGELSPPLPSRKGRVASLKQQSLQKSNSFSGKPSKTLFEELMDEKISETKIKKRAEKGFEKKKSNSFPGFTNKNNDLDRTFILPHLCLTKSSSFSNLSESSSSSETSQNQSSFFNRRRRSMLLKKDTNEASYIYELHKHTRGTLNLGITRESVKTPDNQEKNEWLATHVCIFLEQIKSIYKNIKNCTASLCPIMNAGARYEYLWIRREEDPPVKLSAPEHIYQIIKWIEETLEDDSIFPSNIDIDFPNNFQPICCTIFKRLFRIYAHIYYSHLPEILQNKQEEEINSSFKHFYYFAQEHNLLRSKDCEALHHLISRLCP